LLPCSKVTNLVVPTNLLPVITKITFPAVAVYAYFVLSNVLIPFTMEVVNTGDEAIYVIVN
jgi:hypothetical protein